MMLIYILIVIILLCLCAQGFFAASEMALISLDYIRVKNKAEKGNSYARVISFFLEHPRLLFGTTLLGVNLAIILNSATASFLTRVILETYGISIPYQVQSVITTSVMVPVILFFGEIIPMGFSRLNPEWIMSKAVILFRALHIAMYPLIRIVASLSRIISRITGSEMNVYASLTTREELESYISNSFTASETSSMFNIEKIINETFMFSETPAAHILTSLEAVKAVPHTAVRKDIWKYAGEHGHSRLPMYRNKKENIIGYIQVTDFVSETDGFPLIQKKHSPLIVSETVSLSKLLSLMKNRGEHMAFATDQFGTVSGIVTDEDIIENIFGRIYDEHDNSKNGLFPHTYIGAHPDMSIKNVNRV